MRRCNFTRFLHAYIGDEALLSRHLSRCEYCQTQLQISREIDRLPCEETPQCPDAGTLSAFQLEMLAEQEADPIAIHVEQCGHCLSLLRERVELEADDSNLVGILEQADRELIAYKISKGVLFHLTGNVAGDTADSLLDAFNQGFEASMEKRSDVEGALRPEGLAAFAPSGGMTLYQRILRLSLVVAETALLTKSFSREELLQTIKRNRKELSSHNLGGDLLTEALDWLESCDFYSR